MNTTGLPDADATDIVRVTEALQMITPRWHARILLTLSQPPQRYTDIAIRLPHLQSGQLHPRLRALCDAGLAERTEHSSRHVLYGLTDRGQQLLPVFQMLGAWAHQHLGNPSRLPLIDHVEDALARLSRRQTPAILWALRFRREATARALAHLVIPGNHWASVYTPLRRLADDGLVVTAGTGCPYRLSPAGEALAPALAALSVWAAGRPMTEAVSHRLWGRPRSLTEATTGPQPWTSHRSRLPAPPARPGSSMLPAAGRHTPHAAWRHHDLFSHPSAPVPQMAGATR
ncbi:winged helix-turn-helix transcriptional regulator [Streptomyces fragilis]|uniref:Helix-turn-helix domain-containing protein n=1 Tax=Streptomyces fragilis TaxID=67301 RepID=A0ABV2YC98_9ACTN|nr:helix-turn-helix domain-containing protein [Streptomyces fragilis]